MVMKKQILLFSVMTLLFSLVVPQTLQAQAAENPYVIITEYTLDAAKADDALDIFSELQQKTLETQESCLVYDVLVGEDDPAKVFLYESFETEADYKKHINSAYYKDLFGKKLKPLIKQAKTTKVFPLNFDQISDEEV